MNEDKEKVPAIGGDLYIYRTSISPYINFLIRLQSSYLPMVIHIHTYIQQHTPEAAQHRSWSLLIMTQLKKYGEAFK